ncbi:TetR/AcrR family transcriptional regulator [Methylosinus sp. H3A]|uniref:TetR/AcrR family transcriptional regulator n=1 Tax=Methylosinus sp. H3A TaxID=2785786 RepID=UPI0018C21CC0|nr:TetR/AcrR family transcriptional regulator [Methylosinus sp. H3A]MBG0811366.1 TetR/AcrR family transcriptional regulator [Methylosinus sp. H3A]
MATSGKTNETGNGNGSVRDRIVESLMRLAARRAFEDIAISDIAHDADVSLADFRDNFPSKGAVLAAFSRKIDRQVLEDFSGRYASEPAKERLYEVLLRRLEALEPYRNALESVSQWASTDPLAAAALNRETVNSMRFMLEAADIDSEGALGALKLQGLAIAWWRVLGVWFDDRDADLCRTKAALDRELSRSEAVIERIEDVNRLTSPLRSLARAVFRGVTGHHRHRHHARDRDEGFEEDYEEARRRHHHAEEHRRHQDDATA